MTELLDGYTTDRFPYSEILGELTLEARDKGMGPIETYAEFLDRRDAAELSPYFDYASTSITTGGHALYLPNIGEVISANTRTAREMVTLLDRQGALIGPRVVLPVDMGKTGWTQAGFMTYWGLTIAGPDIREPGMVTSLEYKLSHQLEAQGADLELMNDASIDREDRWPEYEKFIGALTGAIGSSSVRCLPAYRLISLVDPDISLGCRAEKHLANQLQIPTARVMPVKLSTVEEAVPFEPLRHDLKVIMAAGGSVCVAQRNSILTLVGEE